MTIVLDLHDFSIENNNLYYLEQLREHYPAMKVSMFYIPVDVTYYAKLIDDQKDEARELIRKAVRGGWLELIPHGITHGGVGEFAQASYKDMDIALKAYEEHFKEFDLPYVKGFCAPNWLISEEAIKCLDDHGWFLATDRNQPDALKAKRNYVYTWDIADPFPKDKEQVLAHGHISMPSRNNLPQCIVNLVKIPPDAQWTFVSEIMKEASEKTA